MSLEGGTYGGFPIKFLVLVVSICARMKIYTETIKLYFRLKFMSANSKCMNAFHSNFYITNCYHLETLCT